MAASVKRMDPGDLFSTNAGYLTDDSTTTNLDSTASSSLTSAELDTATSRQPLSTGSHPGPASNPSPSHSVSTDTTLPSYSVSTDYTPSLHSVSTTDDHSPPSTEPQNPGAPESENSFGKLMKGKFKRRISMYYHAGCLRTSIRRGTSERNAEWS